MLNTDKKVHFLTLIILCLAGCTPTCKDCFPLIDATKFFDTTIGKFIEYNVVEETYSLGQAPQIHNYQLKEVVAEKLPDITQKPAYRIVRYRRANDTQPWQQDSTFVLRFGVDYVVRNEQSKDFVKMISPLAEKSQWNANLYNNLGEDMYELRNVNKPYIVKNLNFDHTATVIQQNDSTLVGQDKRVEIYAEGVGLIYKEIIIVQFCSTSPSCIGKAQIDFGTRKYMSIGKTGHE